MPSKFLQLKLMLFPNPVFVQSLLVLVAMLQCRDRVYQLGSSKTGETDRREAGEHNFILSAFLSRRTGYHLIRVRWAPHLQGTLKSKMAVTPTEVLFTGDEDDSCSIHEEHVEYNDVIGPRRVTIFTTSCTKRQIRELRLTLLPRSVGVGWIQQALRISEFDHKVSRTDRFINPNSNFFRLSPPPHLICLFPLLILFEFHQTRLCLTTFLFICFFVCSFCSLLPKNPRERCLLLPSYNAVNYASRRQLKWKERCLVGTGTS